MNKAPLVSVVIPSFNHKEFVLKAIRSVIYQTYENVELIVVDDGSTDGSVELLNAAAREFGFHFIAQENAGVCKTLNRGIREFSKGEYVCTLASDDYFEITKIQKQMDAIFNSDNSEYCYTQATEFDSETGKIINVFPRKKFFGNVLNKLIIRQPYAAGSVMFTKGLYNRIGGFDECLPAEDWDFSLRCAAMTKFVGVHEPLFYYRHHPESSMRSMGRRKIFQVKAMILAKNYPLVSPFRWLCALLFHFFYDHGYSFIKYLNIKKVLN
jgi:alpha-1,3-rhamnosyltransferase